MAAKMTTGLLFFLLLVGTVPVAAGRISKPDFSIGINLDHDATTGTFGGATPRVRWNSDEVSVAGWFDVQGGIDSTFTDIKKAPDTYVWGEAKRIHEANAIAIRGDMRANERDVVDLDLRINNSFRNALGLRVLGSADLHSKFLTLDRVMASASIDTPLGMPGSLKVNPQYDLHSKVTDATAGYSFRNTSFKIEARRRKFTLAHVFGRENRNQIVPTLAATTAKNKDFGLSYSRDLSRGSISSKVTTTWKPDDSISVQWTDGNLDATVRAPLWVSSDAMSVE
eukprot:CAMPEP_0168180838 /NCGR_PEP_ID=MMETSP0139_2-20121125/10806_1 /TAXON_ID=44445 /ORGANISM="Pseudo-nitzschia australis, Strain 10249 10 AB" /LENGTH=281 /DNA_ID=CAMNT_0008101193 /DNA_START=221 /DNA_END=1067 /DNA_ORIENTATION=-